MKDLYTLQTLDQVKALTDPLRQAILGALCRGPMTTKQVAEQLDEKPTRLYHHVTTLEQAGLIQLVETRQVRGTIEKYYQAVATKYSVDRSLFQVAAEPGEASSGSLLILNTLEEALAYFQDERTQPLVCKQIAQEKLAFVHATNLCLTQRQVADLKARMCAWLEECVEECEAGVKDAGPSYALTLVLYPTGEVDVAAH